MQRVLRPMRDVLADGLVITADAYIASLDIAECAPAPLVVDRRPAGMFTPAGPDEGSIARRGTPLDVELQHRSRQAAEHPWHAANAGWWEIEDVDSGFGVTHEL